MELVVKNARLPESGDAIADIAISGGMIAAIEPNVTTGGPVIDAGGRLCSSGRNSGPSMSAPCPASSR